MSRRTMPASSSALGSRPSALRALALATLIALLVPTAAQACAVCYGAPGDPMVKGVNNGIWVLLGLVGFVQIGFVAMFWSFWKRAQMQRRFRESFRIVDGGPEA